MNVRSLASVIPGVPTSDGAGVKLRRSIGAEAGKRLDPFLMLDEFGTDQAADYIGGFPPHPHRGFETVTYMIDGHMRHEDHLGNIGELKSGGVQWMTAGRGIIHSEMPQQDQGRLRGFQLWLNLPASAKMQPPRYQDIPAERIPTIELSDGGTIRLIAGHIEVGGRSCSGPVNGEAGSMTTDPLFMDVALAAGAGTVLPLSATHNAFVYVYAGSLQVGEPGDPLPAFACGILGAGDTLQVTAVETARFIVVAGKPLGEPVVQYGPFVMNSRAEIEQALADYREGRLVA